MAPLRLIAKASLHVIGALIACSWILSTLYYLVTNARRWTDQLFNWLPMIAHKPLVELTLLDLMGFTIAVLVGFTLVAAVIGTLIARLVANRP